MRLRELRESRGVTQDDMALVVGKSRTTYTKYENGIHEPDNATLQTHADYFDVSTDYLLGRTDDPTPPGTWVDPPIRDDDDEIRLDEIGYALYGESQELSENNKLVLLDMAKALRARAKEREGKQ